MKIDNFSGKYNWLSNFYKVDITFGGRLYPSVEHAYQAAKTLNEEEIEAIRTAPTAGIAKKLGKYVTLRSDWEEIKLSIMKEFLVQKFSKDPLRALLLETGDSEIIEGNTWGDIFWGVCKGFGENNLGKLLMQVRTELNTLDEKIQSDKERV